MLLMHFEFQEYVEDNEDWIVLKDLLLIGLLIPLGICVGGVVAVV